MLVLRFCSGPFFGHLRVNAWLFGGQRTHVLLILDAFEGHDTTRRRMHNLLRLFVSVAFVANHETVESLVHFCILQSCHRDRLRSVQFVAGSLALFLNNSYGPLLRLQLLELAVGLRLSFVVFDELLARDDEVEELGANEVVHLARVKVLVAKLREHQLVVEVILGGDLTHDLLLDLLDLVFELLVLEAGLVAQDLELLLVVVRLSAPVQDHLLLLLQQTLVLLLDFKQLLAFLFELAPDFV